MGPRFVGKWMPQILEYLHFQIALTSEHVADKYVGRPKNPEVVRRQEVHPPTN